MKVSLGKLCGSILSWKHIFSTHVKNLVVFVVCSRLSTIRILLGLVLDLKLTRPRIFLRRNVQVIKFSVMTKTQHLQYSKYVFLLYNCIN